MKIVKIETVPITLRLKKAFREAPAVYDVLNHVIVKVLTDNGLVGLGEACPTPPADEESAESVIYAIKRYLGPRITGENPFNLEKIVEGMDWLPLNTYAKSAIDMALFDIMGKAMKIPVYELLGGSYRERILGGWELYIDEPKQMAKQAEEAIDMGFKQLKIKVGVDPKLDIKRFEAVREAVGYDIAIAADANQGWKTYEAIKVIKNIDQYEPAFVEQPVPRWDNDGLVEVARAVNSPIMVDESLRTLWDAYNLVKRGAARCFNMKIPKHGGLYNSKKIAAIAEAAGVSCMVGTMWELGVAAAAGYHLAASTKAIDLGNEIIEGPLRVEDDLLVEPLKAEKGYFEVPKGPGLGIELDEKKLRKYAERFKAQT